MRSLRFLKSLFRLKLKPVKTGLYISAILALFAAAGRAAGWTTLMTEGFEGTFPSGAWTSSDKNGAAGGEYYWDKVNYRAYSGSWSGWVAKGGANGIAAPGPYPNSWGTRMKYGPFSLLDATDAELNFNYWLDTEASGDYFKIMVSVDGTNFTELASGSGANATWPAANISLKNYTGKPQVWVAFDFDSNASNAYEGVYIDNIALRKYTPKWTFMVYLDGDNDLEQFAVDDFLEMAAVNNPNINIIVQMDRGATPGADDTRYDDWTATKRYRVTNGMAPNIASAVEDKGELNMGDHNTLVDFVNWSTSSYTADHYALVIWDHGGGSEGRAPEKTTKRALKVNRSDRYKGMCWDDTNGSDYISTTELDSALAQVPHLNIIAFDACLMQMLEVGYQIKDRADIMIGSEEIVGGEGMKYTETLLPVTNTTTPDQFAQIIYDKNRYTNNNSYYTVSALRLGTPIAELAGSVSAFGRKLKDNMGAYKPQINTARVNTQKFAVPEYLDLYHFASNIQTQISQADIWNAAEDVKTRILAARSYNENSGGGYINASGISIYLTSSPASYIYSDYVTPYLAFPLDTQWDEFINSYLAPNNFAGAARGVSSVTWTWDSDPAAVQYKFYPSTGGAAIALANTTLTQILLSTNTAYGGRVSVVNSGGESALTPAVTAYTLAAPPVSPVVVSVGTGSFSVSWGANGNPDGTQYQIDLWTLGGSTTSAQIAAAGAAVGSLAAGTTYYLRVSAINGNGIFSAPSQTISVQTLPPPPGNLSGSGQGVSSIAWTWNSIAGAIQYKFYPSTGGAAIAAAGPALTQTLLSTNTAYGARVSAVVTGGEGALTATVTAYTLAAPPVSLASPAVGVSSVSADWGVNENPAGTFFTLEYSANNFSSIAGSSRTALNSASFSSLLANTSYYLRAKAENALGTATAYTSVLTAATYAAAPAGLALTQLSSSTLRAVWERNSNPTDTQFEVGLSSDDFAADITTPLPFSAASAVIQAELAGLSMDTTYYARVRARNRYGFTTTFSTASYFIPANLTQSIDPALQSILVFGNATLTIPVRSFSETINVTMSPPGSFPANTSHAASLSGIGSGIDITTDKSLLPSKWLTLTVTYSTAQAAGLDESRFLIARYDTARSAWVPYASTPDPAGNRVTALIDHLSLFQVMMATPAGSLSSAVIKVYPNPVRPSRGQTLKFTGLPANASVKLYTFQGELVRELTADAGGLAQWDVRNASDQPVASEVYLALIKAGSDTRTVKVMVER